LAVASVMRKKMKISNSYPIDIIYDDIPYDLIEMAQSLGRIEKPVISDIESVLLYRIYGGPNQSPNCQLRQDPPEPVHVVESKRNNTPDVPQKLPSDPKPIEKHLDSQVKKPPKSKTIEVDGIKFTSNENLTTLDSKIVSNHEQRAEIKAEVHDPVKFNRDYAPLTEKQFVERFISRIKGKSTAT
jgi:hypothetical protein